MSKAASARTDTPMTQRRFPPPWSVEDTGTGSAFVVKDSTGQGLAYVYFEEEPGQALACPRPFR